MASERVGAKALGALGLNDLCFYLGYEYRSDFISTLYSYLDDYEARYTPIPPGRKANWRRAHECAQHFLFERDRGYQFWPPTSSYELKWPSNQQDITLAVAHIIQRRAVNQNLKRKRTEDAEVSGAIEDKTTNWEQPQKMHRSLSPPSSSACSRNSLYQGDDNKVEDNPFGVDPESFLKSWKQPAKIFGRKRCMEYLMTLSPRNDNGDLAAFTAEWLNKEEGRYSWPQSADRRLQMFMHERNCYFSEALQENVLREIVDYVTRGTELQHGITPLQHKELQCRVELRMEFYTNHFSRMRFLDSKVDEAPKRTERFGQLFNSLVEQWSRNVYDVADFPDREALPPKKRRKKGKTIRSKLPSFPVCFPNLVVEASDVPWSTAAPNTDSARDTAPPQDTASQESRIPLDTIVVSSCGVANLQEEEEEEEEDEGEEEDEEGQDKYEGDRAHAANIQNLAGFLAEPELFSASPSAAYTSLMSTFGGTCEEHSNRDTRPTVDLIDYCSSDASRTSAPSLLGGSFATDQDSPRHTFLALPLPGQSQAKSSEMTLLYTQSDGEIGISPSCSQEVNAAHTEPKSVIPSDAGASSINELNAVNSSAPLQPRPDNVLLARPQNRGILGEIASDGMHLSPVEVRQRDIAVVATEFSKPQTTTPIFYGSQYEKGLEVLERQRDERRAPSTFGSPTIEPPFSLQQSPQQLQRGNFSPWASVNGSQQPRAQNFYSSTASTSTNVSAEPSIFPNSPINRVNQMDPSGSVFSHPPFQTIPYFQKFIPPTLNTMNVVHLPPPTFSIFNAPQAMTQHFTLPKLQISSTNRSQSQEQTTPDHYGENLNCQTLGNKFPTSPSNHSNVQNISQSPVERIEPSLSQYDEAWGIPIPQSILPEPQRYETPMSGASRQQGPFCTMPSSAPPLVLTPLNPPNHNPTMQDPISHNAVGSTQSLPVLQQNETHHTQLPRAGNAQSEDHTRQSRLVALPPTPGRQLMSPQSISSPTLVSNMPDRPSEPTNSMANASSQLGETRSSPHFSTKPASVKPKSAPGLHLFIPSPPQTSSRRLRSTSPVQGTSSHVAQDPPLAHNHVVPSSSPSQLQHPAQDGHPCAMVPEGTLLDLDNSPEYQIAQKLGPAIKLSVDTTPLRSPEHGSDGSQSKVELFTQKANGTFDLNRPISGKELEESSLAQFFQKYSGYSGVPLSMLTTLTFETFVGFKIEHQEFVVKSCGSEKEWDKFKKRLNHFMDDDPEETDL